MEKIDLTDQRFGRLVVKEEAGRNKRGDVLWKCVCDCGGIKITNRNSLRSGHTKSCNCLVKEMARDNAIIRNTTHGLYGISAHKSWVRMIQRCTNKNYSRFSDYGGHGIKVCDRWRLFKNFYADMGDRPEGKTINRIDNDGDYEPGNCSWATLSEQQHNQRMFKNNTTGYTGVYFNKETQRYYAQVGLNNKRYHLGCFKTIEGAIKARKLGELEYWGRND